MSQSSQTTHIDSLFSASSTISAGNATTQSVGTDGLNASHNIASSVSVGLPPTEYTMSTSATLTPMFFEGILSESVAPASSADAPEPSVTPILVALGLSSIPASPSWYQGDHSLAPSTLNFVFTSARASTSTPIPVSSTSTSILLTTTRGSIAHAPTGSSTANTSSTSNRLLLVILGPVFGIIFIAALAIIAVRRRVRKQTTNMSDALSSYSETSLEGKEPMMTMEATPRVNAVALGQRITSYRVSSTHTPQYIATRVSKSGGSSSSGDGQLFDPFADSSEDVVSSRTSVPPASMHSTDSLSTHLAFASLDSRDVSDPFGDVTDSGTSSLELRFASPDALTDDSSIRSLHLPSPWHYEGLSPSSSAKEKGPSSWNAEGQNETSPLTPRLRPFRLGAQNARLRLHELLKEARRA